MSSDKQNEEFLPITADKEPAQVLHDDQGKIADYMEKFLLSAYPYYSKEVNDVYAAKNIEENSKDILENMQFFRVASCTIEKTDDVADFFNKKMSKLLSAAYSSGHKICFGFIGRKDRGVSLLLGIDPCKNQKSSQSLKDIAQGILPGITLEDKIKVVSFQPSCWGMMEAVPSLKIDDEKQKIDYTGLLRSLNDRDFNFFIMGRPIPPEIIQEKIDELLSVETVCSSLLKRNYSYQSGSSQTVGTTSTDTHTSSWSVGGNVGAGVAFSVGPVGIMVNRGIGFNYGRSHSHSESESFSETVSQNSTAGFEVENFFAKELMDYTDDALSRLKAALVIGGWDSVITYSANDISTLNLIQGYVYSDVAKTDIKKIPARMQRLDTTVLHSMMQVSLAPEKLAEMMENTELLIPKSFWLDEYEKNLLTTPVNSDELAMLFSFPESSAPGFELREGKFYSLTAENSSSTHIGIGRICDGERDIPNAPFSFSRKDINKHTFICGITGCGKTNSVKKILRESKTPFFILECAKKEYRNLTLDQPISVFTPGLPEINSPQFNPFYILPGVSLQTHIDYLKDLFNASFSFYGPMTYILDTCLHRIYRNRGWNSFTGDHPLLVNFESDIDRYNAQYVNGQYAKKEHKFLFPTMQDLLKEVKNYIDKELTYDSEVSGNIKSAMLSRLESMCAGAKGYMFNNLAPADMKALLSRNVVWELEGLSDDSDKAFVVGLLIVFINEFRKSDLSSEDSLKHILVIEEAHRLLKNVSTERTNEFMGNPKGKAVEHFTNMLAEMRSYGQGVIIAEQIPSKIAPEVVKNSSNKIVHRLVSRDDQEFMANTIGIKTEDSIYLGVQKTGFALCHKEGMYTPVSVKIDNVTDNTNRTDSAIREEAGKNGAKQDLLKYQIKTLLSESKEIDLFGIKLLDSLLYLSMDLRKWEKECKEKSISNPLKHFMSKHETELDQIFGSIQSRKDMIRRICLNHMIAGTFREKMDVATDLLAEEITALLCSRIYSTKRLPDGLLDAFKEAFINPEGKKSVNKTSQEESPDKMSHRKTGSPNSAKKDILETNLTFLLKALADYDMQGNLVVDFVTHLAIKSFRDMESKKKQPVVIDRDVLIKSFFLVADNDCITTISRRICELYPRKAVR